MKLTDALKPEYRAEFEAKGYALPKYDREALKKKTFEEPTWLHFGAGNIFRAYQAALLEDLLDQGACDRGLIVAESFDYEILDKAYRPYDNLALSVVLHSDGSIERNVIGSITESLKADRGFSEDWTRLTQIFRKPSLQLVTFSITEKGYSYNDADLAAGMDCRFAMGKVTALLYERFLAGAYPICLQSTDNCSHNGDKVKAGVYAYAERWEKDGLVPPEFTAYVKNGAKVSFPWTMIDKITPRPDSAVKEMLKADGFEDYETIVTERKSFTAPWVNSEETGYLVIEDDAPNGRPPLEKAGVLFTARETVDKVERMKVTTCLNPLHTAMSIYGCMLGYTLISAETKDPDIFAFISKMGYNEGMPVVTDPGIIDPKEFLNAVLTKRLPNPFMPDAPQRIATDTSQKVGIRFGETIKGYLAKGMDLDSLTLIPLALAGYARYLKGIDDEGKAFEPSSDPLLSELQQLVSGLEVKEGPQDFSCLRSLYSRADIFGLNLYDTVLGSKIEDMVSELYAGSGAVRRTLHKYVTEA